MTRRKCDMCGEIKDCPYTLHFDDLVFGFELKLCHYCGSKVTEHIKKEEGKK